MAFPASLSTTQRAFEQALFTATALRQNTLGLRNASEVGPVSRAAVVELWRQLGAAINIWNDAAGVPGIGQYARDQLSNQSIDIAVEFTNMVSAANTLIGWLNTNFPRDPATQAILVETISPTGVRTNLTFTSAQLAQFRVQADAFIATIS
jgi:hypothetical protein